MVKFALHQLHYLLLGVISNLHISHVRPILTATSSVTSKLILCGIFIYMVYIKIWCYQIIYFFLRLFKACHSYVSPKNFILGCEYDSCHKSNPAVVCTSLQSYARACSQAGICIHWRNYTNLCSKLYKVFNYFCHNLSRFSKISDFWTPYFGSYRAYLNIICIFFPQILNVRQIKFSNIVVQLSHHAVIICMSIYPPFNII